MLPISIEELPLIGQGTHGKVYRLDEKRCIKVYKDVKYLQLEFRVLKHSQYFPQFPRIYECRGNYMIREFFDGPNAKEYIKRNGLSRGLCHQLIEIIDIFKMLGYTRLDCRFAHLIVVEGEKLKIIDPTRNMDKVSAYPRHMLKALDRLGYKQTFLQYVKRVRPDYYKLWKDK